MRYRAKKNFTIIDKKGNKQEVKKNDLIVEYEANLFLNHIGNSNTYFSLSETEIEEYLEKRDDKYCVYRQMISYGSVPEVLFIGTEDECNQYFDVVNKKTYKKHGRADIEQIWVDVY